MPIKITVPKRKIPIIIIRRQKTSQRGAAKAPLPKTNPTIEICLAHAPHVQTNEANQLRHKQIEEIQTPKTTILQKITEKSTPTPTKTIGTGNALPPTPNQGEDKSH